MTHNHKVTSSSLVRPTNYYLFIVKFNYFYIMKVKFIIAGINKELPIIETDKINIKENEILSINFTNKSKSEYSDFSYLAGKRFKIINIERVVNIETIISTFMEDNDINIYIEEIN